MALFSPRDKMTLFISGNPPTVNDRHAAMKNTHKDESE